MPPAISRKPRGAVGMFVVFALLLTALLLLWPRWPQAVSRIIDVRVTGLLEETNGVVGVTVVLSNRTLHAAKCAAEWRCTSTHHDI
jgi:hypothetical protein